jgi:fucose 4-O-acetylase-like acetyltransferase
MITTHKARIEWVDVFRFLGIWAIYVGHFGTAAGKAFPFVFTYHVPMFFFAAGFFSSRYSTETSASFIRKKTLQLMLPYVFFSMMALVVFTLQNNWGAAEVRDAVTSFAFGIRNQVYAGSLWFIPCLYLVIVIDYFVLKIFRLPVFSLAVSIGAFIMTQSLLPNNPAQNPSWFLNLDSALYYYIYYSFGRAFFPYLNKEQASLKSRLPESLLIIMTIAMAAIIYLTGSDWLFGKLVLQFPVISAFELSYSVFNVFMALILIYFNVLAAKLFAHVLFFGELGRETLILCGTEDVLKSVFMQLLEMLRLRVDLINPFITISFSLICLIVSKYTLIRFLNTHFPQVVGKIKPGVEKMPAADELMVH